ncbi:MAG: hypothetical protein AB7V56_09420 [Candidatus Nitrosocosmicus sp.]
MQKVRKFSHSFSLKISKEKNMFVAERYLSDIVKEYGKHPVSADGEITMQYIKDRTEGFDDYFPCRKKIAN